MTIESEPGDAAFSLREAIPVLERTPRILHAWLDGLSEAWLDCNEGTDTFSPYDVVGHLIHGEKTDWIPRLRQIMAGRGDRPFEPFDRFAMRGVEPVPLDVLLRDFSRLRADNVSILRTLDPGAADLCRTGIHPDLGTVTVAQLLATWTAHDLAHLAQIARVMAKRYATAVGPWRTHLRVMDRE